MSKVRQQKSQKETAFNSKKKKKAAKGF